MKQPKLTIGCFKGSPHIPGKEKEGLDAPKEKRKGPKGHIHQTHYGPQSEEDEE